MSAVKTLDTTNFDSEVAGPQPVMVDFYTDWCAPCQILGPQVERIAQTYADRASVAKLNVDASGQVAARFGVQGIPTVLFFKDGKLVDRVVGLVPEEELTSRLDSLID
ncbi:MAG: thioredoxin [Candidatus Glassbacteria bacterium]|nr:thioredoxin [Candidatus Glassbacteria bacterium]